MGPVLQIALAVASFVSSKKAANKQISLARKSANASRRANEIQQNRETFDNTQDVRRRVRQRRVAAAKVAQGAETSGVSGSSAEAGTFSNLASNLGANRSTAQGSNITAGQIGFKKQLAKNLDLKSSIVGAKNDIFQSALSTTSSIFETINKSASAAGG